MLNTTYISECFANNTLVDTVASSTVFSSNGWNNGINGLRYALNNVTTFPQIGMDYGQSLASSISAGFSNMTMPTIDPKGIAMYLGDNWLAAIAGVATTLYFTRSVSSLWAQHKNYNAERANLRFAQVSIFAPSNLCTTGLTIGLQFAAATSCILSPFTEKCPALMAISMCASAVVSYKLTARALKYDLNDLQNAATSPASQQIARVEGKLDNIISKLDAILVANAAERTITAAAATTATATQSIS
jgi:hypothetical protein